ncbi:MAG: hypothetical protein K8I03_02535, partial [Ignavibacteria bacterium]|nr:hypothetical protein [Ignavibacteria bacterium]
MLNREEIKSILEAKYSKDNWLKLIKSVSNEPSLYSKPNPLNIDKNIAKKGYELGSFTTSDGMLIGLYEIEINDNIQIERNRVGLRNLLRKQYKQVDGCFAVYYQGNKWRFSYISETREKDKKGDWIDSKTEPKRYTYVLGVNEKVRSAIDRIDILYKSSRALADIKEAFSVERVTKEFFQNVAILFTKLAGGNRRVGSKIVSFTPQLKLPGTKEKKALQEFSVRLLGRIVFCWFLNKKVSKNGLPLIPTELLSKNAVLNYKNFYHTVLERLFFEALNTKSEERKNLYKTGAYKNVPFLNGGLFEPNDDDYYHPALINSLIIPDIWLLELFGTLESFNFTIDENTSIDIELSVDPEMLGRIFENLLAEINPETGETARKATGSYYTPRDIVEYMVDESLKLCLRTKTGIKEHKLNSLVSYSDQETELTKSEKKDLLAAIDEMKIIDPACGSGAYPIGILQKMLLVLQKIDPNSELWFEKMVSSIDDKTLREQVKQKFKNENLNFIRKFGLIQKCIYGVDMQTIAVELSKLRCFLTLIVDEEIDDNKHNRGIIPLPNLEFKFVSANALIGLEDETDKISLFDESGHIKELESFRNEYFVASGKYKVEIENKIVDIQKKIALIIAQRGDYSGRALQLATWEPFSHKSSNWFDPKLMFGVVNGFDIVIGNPPYIEARKLEQTFVDTYRKSYLSAGNRINTFPLFIEK